MKKVVWGMIGCGDVTEKKNGQEEIFYFDKPEQVAMPFIQSIVDERRGDESCRYG